MRSGESPMPSRRSAASEGSGGGVRGDGGVRGVSGGIGRCQFGCKHHVNSFLYELIMQMLHVCAHLRPAAAQSRSVRWMARPQTPRVRVKVRVGLRLVWVVINQPRAQTPCQDCMKFQSTEAVPCSTRHTKPD